MQNEKILNEAEKLISIQAARDARNIYYKLREIQESVKDIHSMENMFTLLHYYHIQEEKLLNDFKSKYNEHEQ